MGSPAKRSLALSLVPSRSIPGVAVAATGIAAAGVAAAEGRGGPLARTEAIDQAVGGAELWVVGIHLHLRVRSN